MNFQYSVIGDNTKDNREHLEKLGYDNNRILYLKKNEYDIIISVFFDDGTYSYMEVDKEELEAWVDSNKCNGIEAINCIGNPQLFKAVSAMRDDSDKDQYFIGISGDASDIFNWYYCLNDKIDAKYFRKATLSELQEHFQRV